MTSNYTPGEQVRSVSDRTKIGVIVSGPRSAGDKFEYQIRFGQELVWKLEPHLERVVASDPGSLFIDHSFDGHESLLRLVTYNRLNKPFSDTLLTRFANKIDYLPYQWLPLLRILESSDQRLLIADEVGLGKTIEAGIIHRELSARQGGLKKVLVVARTGELNNQWKGEFEERFNQEFELWNSDQFVTWIEGGERNQYWDVMHAIIGRHSLQRDPVLSSILRTCTIDGEGQVFSHPRIDLDLLIVDESHHLRNPNNLNKAINWLARCAKSVVFLTATPIHLHNNDLYNQLRILLPKRFSNETFFYDEMSIHRLMLQAVRQLHGLDKDALTISLLQLSKGENISDLLELVNDLSSSPNRARLLQQIESFSPLANVITRKTRRDLPYVQWPQRNAISKEHSLTEEEQNLYRNLIVEHYKAIASGLAFGKTTALRLAATCMPVAMSLHGLKLEQTMLDEDSLDERGEIKLSGSLDLEKLIELPDSRFHVMWFELERIWATTPNSKVIIFSFFVDVLDYLSKKFEKLGVKHVLVHGKNPSDRSERSNRYYEYRDNPEIRVLLSSEVGTEGLNLQIADTIVNYNLPWNPMVVEQRIGRIDRKGQKSPKIRIVNLFATGTIENEVIRRLLDRIQIFQDSIGDLEPIMGNIERTIAEEFINPNLSEHEIKTKADALGFKIELERMNQHKLEEAARDQLLADLPFDPVEKAMEEGRYVSSEHIRLLVDGFIRKETPSTTIRRIENNVWQIDIRQDLYSVLSENERLLDLTQSERISLRKAQQLSRIQIAFDSDTAVENNLELVAPGHWLTRIICSSLAGRESSFHPVSAVEISSDKLLDGYYAYGLFSLEMNGFRDKRMFLPVVMSLDSKEFSDSAISNEVLNTMLVNGKSLDLGTLKLDYDLSIVCQSLRNELHARTQVHYQNYERESERFKRVRRETEERYYASEIQKVKNTLSSLFTEEQRRIRPVLEQNIRNLETQRDNSIVDLNSKVPGMSHQELGYGIILVVNQR